MAKTDQEQTFEVLSAGDLVEWHWLSYLIEGHVEEVFFAPVERTIKGKVIKRNGSPAKPAYLVRSDSGNIALKLATELQRRQKVFTASSSS